jgi:branched-chain amino acid transport system substrate-binding protein
MIGYAGSLSGLNSDLSVSGRNGAMLAVQDINAKGGVNGREVILNSKDDMNNPDQALAVDKEFYSEGINLIIGHMTSQMAEKSVPYINDNHMLMMSPTIAVDNLSGQDDYFFRVIPSNKTQAKAICDRMIMDGVQKVIIMIDKNNQLFTATLRDFFIDYFEADGGEIIRSCGSGPDEMLCEECIEMLSSNHADGLLIISGSASYTYVTQKLYQLGIQTKLYGPAWAMTVDLLEHGGASVEGAEFPNYYDINSTSPDYVSFRNNYLNIYGNEPSFSAYLSYEAVLVLAAAIKDSKSSDPEIIREYIKNHQEFNGLNDAIVFDGFGDVDRPIYVYKVVSGQFQIMN